MDEATQVSSPFLAFSCRKHPTAFAKKCYLCAENNYFRRIVFISYFISISFKDSLTHPTAISLCHLLFPFLELGVLLVVPQRKISLP
jgi:hypothetical protein